MNTIGFFRDFAVRVSSVAEAIRALLVDLKNEGATIAGFGAAAKATTLLSYSGIGSETLTFIADSNPQKQGKRMPGSRIPIVDPAEIARVQPDYVLVLAWNLADEIIAQLSDYAAQGGRFIVPIPEPRVVEGNALS